MLGNPTCVATAAPAATVQPSTATLVAMWTPLIDPGDSDDAQR